MKHGYSTPRDLRTSLGPIMGPPVELIGTPLYVGQTCDIKTRISSHIASGKSPWVYAAHMLNITRVENSHDRLRIERETITRLNPTYNSMGKETNN